MKGDGEALGGGVVGGDATAVTDAVTVGSGALLAGALHDVAMSKASATMTIRMEASVAHTHARAHQSHGGITHTAKPCARRYASRRFTVVKLAPLVAFRPLHLDRGIACVVRIVFAWRHVESCQKRRREHEDRKKCQDPEQSHPMRLLRRVGP